MTLGPFAGMAIDVRRREAATIIDRIKRGLDPIPPEPEPDPTVADLAARCLTGNGLALAPLFEPKEEPAEGTHAVLLDGGYGSFAMSVTAEELWRDEQIAGWAWSSNLPHHVTVTDDIVAVTRWDTPRAEVISLDPASNHRLTLSTAISRPIESNPAREWSTMFSTCFAVCGRWSQTQIYPMNEA